MSWIFKICSRTIKLRRDMSTTTHGVGRTYEVRQGQVTIIGPLLIGIRTPWHFSTVGAGQIASAGILNRLEKLLGLTLMAI